MRLEKMSYGNRTASFVTEGKVLTGEEVINVSHKLGGKLQGGVAWARVVENDWLRQSPGAAGDGY